MTILVNGGKMSRQDVEYSLMENRPTFVMRGTGRLADEITLTGKVVAIDISRKPGNIERKTFVRRPAMLVLVWMTDF